jgi:hypothetical protein
MAVKLADCPRCEAEEKLRPRDFSDQAIAILVSSGDLTKKDALHPICDDCYTELRDHLIEYQRVTSIPAAANNTSKEKTRRAS